MVVNESKPYNDYLTRPKVANVPKVTPEGMSQSARNRLSGGLGLALGLAGEAMNPDSFAGRLSGSFADISRGKLSSQYESDVADALSKDPNADLSKIPSFGVTPAEKRDVVDSAMGRRYAASREERAVSAENRAVSAEARDVTEQRANIDMRAEQRAAIRDAKAADAADRKATSEIRKLQELRLYNNSVLDVKAADMEVTKLSMSIPKTAAAIAGDRLTDEEGAFDPNDFKSGLLGEIDQTAVDEALVKRAAKLESYTKFYSKYLSAMTGIKLPEMDMNDETSVMINGKSHQIGAVINYTKKDGTPGSAKITGVDENGKAILAPVGR